MYNSRRLVKICEWYEVMEIKVNRVELNAKKILDKKFSKQLFGFKQEEVDKFLDTIIKDYQAFENEIQLLTEELERFKKSTEDKEERPPKQTAPYQVNYDILKRVSNLEKAVFGKKENDEK